MSRYNKVTAAPAGRSPVITETAPSGHTHEGAPGYARDAKSELFLLAVTHMGDGSFYETAAQRNSRFTQLVRQVATADPEWMAGFIPWLRGEANMRTASVLAAAEGAKALLDAKLPGGRKMIASALQRADELGELLAYWHSQYGRALPKPVKRGLADAAVALYTEFSLLKYDTATHGYRFGDVIELTHPDPRAHWQGPLFEHAIDRRHGRDNPVPEVLAMIRANAALRALAAEDPRALLDTGALKGAGMTWEDALSLAGNPPGLGSAARKALTPGKAELWQALIPVMGYMALLRNLRNMDEAGVSDEAAGDVIARITDPDQVAKSRQFPFRFLAAYRAAHSLRWAYPLERALDLSLANVPALKGRTLILVDRSGSMFDSVSAKSGLNRADSAALFGAALTARSEYADLVEFGTGSQMVLSTAAAKAYAHSESLLKMVGRFGNLGGTNTADAVRRWYKGHDRVVILTDEQAWGGFHGGDPLSLIPANVPAYTWNLAGYKMGHGPSGGANRHTFGGLSDASFRMIPLLEAHRDAAWPWLAPAVA